MGCPELRLVTASKRPREWRFDVFKGVSQGNGNVKKIKTVGCAILRSGFTTYRLHLDTFLKDVFHLVPAERRLTSAEFVIMTRAKTTRPGKKFIWRVVGEGRLVSEHPSTLHLTWDLLGVSDIFMTFVPRDVGSTNSTPKTGPQGETNL